MPLSLMSEVPYQLALAISLALAPAAPQPERASETVIATPAKAATAAPAGGETSYGIGEQNWLRLVKDEGPKHGRTPQADRIFVTSTGRYYAPVPGELAAILALRRNPKVAADLARENARTNLAKLAGRLGRTPTGGELYAAHRLGPETALQVLLQAKAKPASAAAPRFPEAAAAAPDLFYDGKRERTCLEIKQASDQAYQRALKARGGVKAPAEMVSLGMLRTAEAEGTVPTPSGPKSVARKTSSVVGWTSRGPDWKVGSSGP